MANDSECLLQPLCIFIKVHHKASEVSFYYYAVGFERVLDEDLVENCYALIEIALQLLSIVVVPPQKTLAISDSLVTTPNILVIYVHRAAWIMKKYSNPVLQEYESYFIDEHNAFLMLHFIIL